MGKRTPPVFHDHYQIHGVPEERYTQRAVVLAVEDPEEPVVRHMKPGNVDGRLLCISIAMRNPGGDKIPIRFYLHAADIFQMSFYQKYPHNHERYRRNNRQINEWNAEYNFPKGLPFIVTANSYSIHYVPCSSG